MRVLSLLVTARHPADSRYQLPPWRTEGCEGGTAKAKQQKNYNIIHKDKRGASRQGNTTSSAQRRGQRRAAPFRSRVDTLRVTTLVGDARDTRIVRE